MGTEGCKLASFQNASPQHQQLGGDRHACCEWISQFYGILASRSAAGEFVGDDQTTLTRVVQEHSKKKNQESW